MGKKNSEPQPPAAYPEAYIRAAQAEAVRLASRHRIAFFDAEDLAQELLVKALDIFPKWDPTRPPAPFLRRALARLCTNVYRDRVRRSDSPCPSCQDGRFCGRGDPEAGVCRPFAEWAARWGRKALLMKSGLGAVGDGSDDVGEEARSQSPPDFAEAELLARLDAGIPSALRADFMRLRQGMALTVARRAAVLGAARAALGLGEEGGEPDGGF